MTSTDDHEYTPSDANDSRSPCPALNALANHGYLPRDGLEIGFLQITQALRKVYNISLPLALFLAISGFMTCAHFVCGRDKNGSFNFGLRLNLADLAAHRMLGIEHDASLSRQDALPGHSKAPVAPDASVLENTLKHARPQHGVESALSIEDFAQARVDREAELAKPMDFLHASMGRAESAFTLLAMRDPSVIDARVVPTEWLRQWYGEERLPVGWTRSNNTVGLLRAMRMGEEIGGIMKKQRKVISEKGTL